MTPNLRIERNRKPTNQSQAAFSSCHCLRSATIPPTPSREDICQAHVHSDSLTYTLTFARMWNVLPWKTTFLCIFHFHVIQIHFPARPRQHPVTLLVASACHRHRPSPSATFDRGVPRLAGPRRCVTRGCRGRKTSRFRAVVVGEEDLRSEGPLETQHATYESRWSKVL